MRVALAEDDTFYRAGLVKLLEAAGTQVSQEAASGDELIAYLRRGPLPDIAILDINMAGRKDDGLIAARQIAEMFPGVGVLLLSAFAEATYAERLFEGGSAGKGYMIKDSLNAVGPLREALERINNRQTYTDPKVLDHLLRPRDQKEPTLRERLTPRERSVLSLLTDGASNAAIAANTHITSGAVEAAVRNIYTKLGIPDDPAYNKRVLVVLKCLTEEGRLTP